MTTDQADTWLDPATGPEPPLETRYPGHERQTYADALVRVREYSDEIRLHVGAWDGERWLRWNGTDRYEPLRGVLGWRSLEVSARAIDDQVASSARVFLDGAYPMVLDGCPGVCDWLITEAMKLEELLDARDRPQGLETGDPA